MYDETVSEHALPVDPKVAGLDDLYVLMSATKSITAVAVLGLVEKGVCCRLTPGSWTPVLHRLGRRVVYAPWEGSSMLGEIIRRLAPEGRSFRDYIRKEVFTPLGMTSSFIGAPLAQPRQRPAPAPPMQQGRQRGHQCGVPPWDPWGDDRGLCHTPIGS